MTTDSYFLQILAQLLGHAPVLLVSIAGLIAVAVRRPAGSAWALAGFGVETFACLAAPISRVLVLSWTASSGMSPTDIARTYTIVGIAWSVLHAAALGLLLTAVLAPRAADGPR